VFLIQQNDESVAANAQEDPKDEGADSKSDQFVVTQEYIQDSMLKFSLF
jgi:hypothetical protein